jgi:hypothetical protein
MCASKAQGHRMLDLCESNDLTCVDTELTVPVGLVHGPLLLPLGCLVLHDAGSDAASTGRDVQPRFRAYCVAALSSRARRPAGCPLPSIANNYIDLSCLPYWVGGHSYLGDAFLNLLTVCRCGCVMVLPSKIL